MATQNNRYQILQQIKEVRLDQDLDYIPVARLIAESLPDNPKTRAAVIWKMLTQAHRNGMIEAAEKLAERANNIVNNAKMFDDLDNLLNERANQWNHNTQPALK